MCVRVCDVHKIHNIIFSLQVAASEGDVEEDTIHCATCGMQVTLKKAMVHMEKCFMKVSILLVLLSVF